MQSQFQTDGLLPCPRENRVLMKKHTHKCPESRGMNYWVSQVVLAAPVRAKKKKNCVTLRLDYSRTWRDKTLIEPPYILRSQVASSLDK